MSSYSGGQSIKTRPSIVFSWSPALLTYLLNAFIFTGLSLLIAFCQLLINEYVMLCYVKLGRNETMEYNFV